MTTTNLRGINLNLLTVFDSMMVERNVTRAGAVLGLSQPAISNSIAQLRTLLNDRLFIRVKNEMIPTARAQALADPIHQALVQVQSALARTNRFDPARSTASFRIGMSNLAAMILLDGLAAQLRRQAAQVKLRVASFDETDLQAALERGEVDLVAGSLDHLGGHGNKEVLFEDGWVCMRSAARTRSVWTLREYLSASHAVLGSKLTDEVDAALQELGHRRNGVMNIPFLASAASLIESSDLLLTLPRRLATAIGRGHTLDMRDVPFAMPQMRVGIAWHSRTHRDEGNTWLRGLTMSLASQQPVMRVA